MSSWCIDVAEKMHGHPASTGVDRIISTGNDQLTKQLDRQEVGSLIRSQPMTEGVAGNCWHVHLQRFAMMNPDEQLCTSGEGAGFLRTVSKDMYYRTGEDVNDVYGNIIASCREYTLPRTHRDSDIKLWIQKLSEIGPFLDVKIICHPEGHLELEIQIPSTSGDRVVISKGPNRYVDDLRYKDPKNAPAKADHECMQDTDQEQPTIQLETSADCILIHEPKWKDIIANEDSHSYKWESQISKVVSKFVRHECRDRGTDGAIHWKAILPKLVVAFRRDGSREFTDKDGSITSGKEAAKPDSSIVRIHAKIFSTSEPFKVTQEEKRLNLR